MRQHHLRRRARPTSPNTPHQLRTLRTSRNDRIQEPPDPLLAYGVELLEEAIEAPAGIRLCLCAGLLVREMPELAEPDAFGADAVVARWVVALEVEAEPKGVLFTQGNATDYDGEVSTG